MNSTWGQQEKVVKQNREQQLAPTIVFWLCPWSWNAFQATMVDSQWWHWVFEVYRLHYSKDPEDPCHRHIDENKDDAAVLQFELISFIWKVVAVYSKLMSCSFWIVSRAHRNHGRLYCFTMPHGWVTHWRWHRIEFYMPCKHQYGQIGVNRPWSMKYKERHGVPSSHSKLAIYELCISDSHHRGTTWTLEIKNVGNCDAMRYVALTWLSCVQQLNTSSARKRTSGTSPSCRSWRTGVPCEQFRMFEWHCLACFAGLFVS